MADFAAMQVVMDIIGDDKEAQKECFESYARMWAQLGTVSYLTDSNILSDVHSSNVVRINAIVASFDQFYEIYGIEEGDPMYVAPEDRLRLWYAYLSYVRFVHWCFCQLCFKYSICSSWIVLRKQLNKTVSI